jgi:hypothetical protein
MSRKVSVERWTKRALQASAMRCGACTEATGLVGVDMVAQDGNVFAHGHFDIQTAIAFQAQLAEAIAAAKRGLQ